jgi:parallel beta-helix repeat protein
MTYDRLTHAFVAGLLTVTVALAGRAGAVDGVIEINQARASKGGITPGDTPGFPITISTGTFSAEPMSFKLTGPLSISTTDNVIEITSPHVTLDLNGFSISCLLPDCSGVAVGSAQANVSVVNGTVRGFAEGVRLLGLAARIENVRATGNVLGLRAASNCLMRNNVVHDNSGDGITAGLGCLVSGNVVTENGGDGIVASGGSNVTGNTVRGNADFGLNGTISTGYSNNVFQDNDDGTVDAGVAAGGNVCETSTTCP